MIAILGDRLWPEKTKQEGDEVSEKNPCNVWKKRNERPHVGDVSTRSRTGALSRKGCVVNDQMTKASNIYDCLPPPPCSASRLMQAMSTWSVKIRRAPSRHCTEAMVYGHTTTDMHGMSTHRQGLLSSSPPGDNAIVGAGARHPPPSKLWLFFHT